MNELDRVIHEPARLLIVTILSSVAEADFLYLLNATELTKGNLSTHLAKLEDEGYVLIVKGFRGKIPLTLISLTKTGREALASYRKQMTALLKPTVARAVKPAAPRVVSAFSRLEEEPS